MLEFRETDPLPLRLVAGDTLPRPELVVRGLEADPTGAAATFSLFDLSDVAELEDAAATVDAISSYTDLGATRWQMRLRYSWETEDTATLGGSYYARFKVTLPADAGVLSAPADRRFAVFVLPVEAP